MTELAPERLHNRSTLERVDINDGFVSICAISHSQQLINPRLLAGCGLANGRPCHKALSIHPRDDGVLLLGVIGSIFKMKAKKVSQAVNLPVL